MNQVSNPNQFSPDDHIAGFTGKSYAEALILAETEAKRVGVTLVSYYEQKFPGRSILVSYKPKNENSS